MRALPWDRVVILSCPEGLKGRHNHGPALSGCQVVQDAIDELKKIECEVKKTPKSPKRRKEKGE
jgi:hypothetical protein